MTVFFTGRAYKSLIIISFLVFFLTSSGFVWASQKSLLTGKLWSLETRSFISSDDFLQSLEPGSWLLVGEQHDHPGHQPLVEQWLRQLADLDRLGVLALEMAHLKQQSALDAALGEAEVTPKTLEWGEGWPWERYESLVVAGLTLAQRLVATDLPRKEQRKAYQEGAAQPAVSEDQAGALDELLYRGHCELLPREQLPAMRQVQLARDQTMAKVLARTGDATGINVFVAGSVHVRQDLGVPRWLPETSQVVSILLQQLNEDQQEPQDYLPEGVDGLEAFDYIYFTPALPPVDYCEELRQSL